WYLKTTAVKDRLLANNASVEWHPPEIGRGRMGEWLENNVDWAISRDRYWGTPLPIWVCDRDPEHLEVMGSYAALAGRAGPLAADFDPHKPEIDAITWRCERCDGAMRRTPEVVDAWFDSGAMPVAQWHYPFENEALFERQFPADYICEGVDQTRGWFYSLLAISTVLFDRAPYRHVLVNDLILDAQGQKMSKSRGNVVDPWTAIGEFGADALRFYFVSVSQPWVPKRYDPEALREVHGKFFDTLRHTYGFFAQYAGLEGWRHERKAPHAERRPLLDRWILSRLDGLAARGGRDLDAYEVTHAARRIADFVVDDLSNWYVRRSRPRFWGTRGADRADMQAAFATLEECLRVVCRLLAPFAPFLSDWIHREVTDGPSVHLASYPESAGREDPALDEGMDAVRRLANLGRAAREAVKVRVRQPLRRLVAVVPPDVRLRLTPELVGILRDELNVKEVRVGADVGEWVALRVTPNFRRLGPAFGAKAPAVAEAIRALDSDAVRRWRETGGPLRLDVGDETVTLDPEAVQVHEETAGDLAVRAEAGYAVALDPTLDDALRREGTARELMSRVQRLRRDAGLRVEDRIRLGIFGPPDWAEAAREHRDTIASETLAVEVEIGRDAPEGGYRFGQDVQVEGAGGRIALDPVTDGRRPERGPGTGRPGGPAARAATTRRPSHR
ncbi:MAG: class I tRNA ligase family protein, partial [Gemmatimonadota bacterium]